MTGVQIRTRTTKAGRRFQVRYRMGGRTFPLVSAGTFKTRKEAKVMYDLVAGWLAAGKNPRVELAATRSEPPRVRTIRELTVAFRRSRIDVSASTDANYRNAFRHVVKWFDGRDPATITPGDVQEFVGYLATSAKDGDGLSPGTIKVYMDAFRLMLDFAGLEPNPARHRTVKMPANRRAEVIPPTAEHVVAILTHIRPRWRLPLVVMEQTAMRPGEAETLVWGDVDQAGNRFRLRGEETKTSRSRWVQVPEWLMDIIVASTTPDDRATEARRVFPGFTVMGAVGAVARACVNAGIPHYSPKGFRHRRASLWHGQGITAAELAARGGWSKATIPLEVYSHVLMDGAEVPAAEFERVLA